MNMRIKITGKTKDKRSKKRNFHLVMLSICLKIHMYFAIVFKVNSNILRS